MFPFRYMLGLFPVVALAAPTNRNTEYTNPIIPGYRPDPTCVAVDGFFYCSSSTFNNFPGLPIYVSQDLIHWRHVSNVIHKEEQIPEYDIITGQQQGIFAPTLRYRNGVFYIITTFMGARPEAANPDINGETSPIHFIFNSTDPLDPGSWGMPVRYVQDDKESFNPDLFWDEYGQAYVTGHVFEYPGDSIYPIDLTTGEYGEYTDLWNGTGGSWPEGPHVYKKDDYHWLVLAEGGTSFNHHATIARSKDLFGPYEAYENNPILTAANTTRYFQSVGHVELFQDFEGNWWGMALAKRTGPPGESPSYPMGRETVLYPVTWEENGWPQLEPVSGRMSGPLPPTSFSVPGNGPWVNEGDDYQFEGKLPLHFMHFRFPPPNSYEISGGSLKLNPSIHNLTGGEDFAPSDRIAYIGRRQTDTLFTYFVDMEFSPETEGEEAGVTLFANQHQHADLGLVKLNGTNMLRLRSTAIEADNVAVRSARYSTDINPANSTDILVEIPEELVDQKLRLMIKADRDTGYNFLFGAASHDGKMQLIGFAPGEVTSGANAQFTGTTVGVFASANGGNGTTPATFSRWMYKGHGQKIDFNEVVYY